MKTIDIKGRPYVMVNERLKYFRGEDKYKGWRLVTSVVSFDADMCLIKAEVIDNDGMVASTGHAYEESANGFINKTSHVENCETSAVGRALGNLGIGIDDSIASAEEIANAIEKGKQPEKPELTPTHNLWSKAVEHLSKDGSTMKDILKKYKVSKENQQLLQDAVI